MGRDLSGELERQAETSSQPSWKPEPGETLTGVLVGYTTRTTKYGPTRLAIVEVEDGSRIQVWLSSVVLKGAFEEQRPRTGDRIGVRYNGRHEQKGYHLYNLVVDRDVDAEVTPGPRAAAPTQRPSAAPPANRGPVNRGPADVDDDDPFVD